MTTRRSGALLSRVINSAGKAPAPVSRKLDIERDVRIEMPDGAVLRADRWYPRDMATPLPTILMRTPYGRTGLNLGLTRPFAEHGFQVLVQSCRGTFGSDGKFEPFRHERLDGLATIHWIGRQPWFDGNLVLAGASYLGYVQWAVSDSLPPYVRAIIPMVTSSNIVDAFNNSEVLSLDLSRRWAYHVRHQEQGALYRVRAMLPGFGGKESLAHPILKEVIDSPSEDDHWRECDVNHRDRVKSLNVPVSMIAGWQDFFLTYQLEDYDQLVAAGKQPRLIIGPWSHSKNVAAVVGAGIREARYSVLPTIVGKDAGIRGHPVQLFITGLGAWRSFDSWPPTGHSPSVLYLQSGRKLAEEQPSAASLPDSFRMSLNDPTPHVGGPGIDLGAGVRNQKSRESRGDVLTYTTSPLPQALTAIGIPSAEISLRTTRCTGHLAVTVCDVDLRGISRNVTEGVARLDSAKLEDGVLRVQVRLRAMGHQFKAGHRLRVQIAGAAYPLYATSDETKGRAWVDYEVFHDSGHSSSITLPVAD